MNKLLATLDDLQVFLDDVPSTGIPETLCTFNIFGKEDHFWYAEVIFYAATFSAILLRNFSFQITADAAREFAAALTLAAAIVDAGPTWTPANDESAVTR